MDKWLFKYNDVDIDMPHAEDTPVPSKIRRINRQYSDDYLSFGFTWIDDRKSQRPLCIICGEKLSNSAMFPSKLQRHFIKKHPDHSSKTKDYFKRCLDMQSKQVKYFKETLTVSEKAQLASYRVAELVAIKLKAHTIAESLILPACCEIVEIMLGDEAKNAIMKVPLSDDTIKNRIKNMSNDIEKTITEKMYMRQFALQIDESVDIGSKSNIIGFVRFIKGNEIVNQFLCCQELTEHATGQEIFDIISKYFQQIRISWEMCVRICTDGAPSMVGSCKGFVTIAKKINPNILCTHCVLHREHLVSKSLPTTLKLVLEHVKKW